MSCVNECENSMVLAMSPRILRETRSVICIERFTLPQGTAPLSRLLRDMTSACLRVQVVFGGNVLTESECVVQVTVCLGFAGCNNWMQ